MLAIQENEAELIRGLTRKDNVLVVGHSPRNFETAGKLTETDSQQIRVGYIGSANYSNWHSLNRFLIEVWPELIASSEFNAELKIAGKICDWFELHTPDRLKSMTDNRIELMGEVDELSDFYDNIDIAINPVQFGTGLKIKNVEAMAYGKPLVTTASGASGMSVDAQKQCRVVRNLQEMAEQLLELCRNPQTRVEEGIASKNLANSEYSDRSVYSELAKHFTELAQNAGKTQTIG
ncbi:MAG: glycosyltransferase family 4 protein [Pirellulaceae bacterium]